MLSAHNLGGLDVLGLQGYTPEVRKQLEKLISRNNTGREELNKLLSLAGVLDNQRDQGLGSASLELDIILITFNLDGYTRKK